MEKLLVIRWILLLVTAPILNAATKVSKLTADQKRLQLINASLNATFSECDDFFRHACWGLGVYRHRLPAGTLEYLDDRIGTELTEDIKQLRPTTEFKFLREIHKYYESCDKEENIIDTLHWMSAEAGIKWPLVAERPDMQWMDLLAAARKYGFNNIFLYEDITPRQEDALKMAIELKRPPLKHLFRFEQQLYGLDHLLNSSEISKFAEFQRKLFKLTVELIKDEGEDNYMTDFEYTSAMESSPVYLDHLNVAWVTKYVQALLEPSKVGKSTLVYVQNIDYLKGLGKFLQEYDNNFLCDYIQIKFLMFVRNQNADLKRTSCTHNIRNLFPLAMQWIYRKWHPELQQDLPHIRNIFDNLKATFKKTIYNMYNFSDDIVEYLLAKIDNIQLSVDTVSVEDLEKYYAPLYLNSSEYLGNHLRLSNFMFKTKHQLIFKHLTRDSITMLSLRPAPRASKQTDSATVLYHLPYLFPRFNLVYLPLTLLQDPTFDSGLDDVYSYSSIGYLLAREITKAFDLSQLRVDAKGRYNTVTEAAIRSNTEFKNAASNLQDSLIKYGEMRHEAFADISGLKLAYDTVLELQPDAWSTEVTLQGKKMNMDKVFFLNFAQNYCSKSCELQGYDNLHYDSCESVAAATGHFDKFGHSFNCENSMSNQLWR